MREKERVVGCIMIDGECSSRVGLSDGAFDENLKR